jgi:ribosomal protein L17
MHALLVHATIPTTQKLAERVKPVAELLCTGGNSNTPCPHAALRQHFFIGVSWLQRRLTNSNDSSHLQVEVQDVATRQQQKEQHSTNIAAHQDVHRD